MPTKTSRRRVQIAQSESEFYVIVQPPFEEVEDIAYPFSKTPPKNNTLISNGAKQAFIYDRRSFGWDDSDRELEFHEHVKELMEMLGKDALLVAGFPMLEAHSPETDQPVVTPVS